MSHHFNSPAAKADGRLNLTDLIDRSQPRIRLRFTHPESFFMNVGLIEFVGGASPLEHRWQAIVQRSLHTEDMFFYGVKTTGIYCRPTCSSRQPKQTNVVFFDNCDEAEAAGFRACKR